MHYPKKLIKHLTKNRHLNVEKSAPGVYHIIKEIFPAQIIVTHELSHNDSLYLRCMTDKELTDRLTDDNSEQSSIINALTSEIDYLKNLLIQHNIPYNLES